MRDPLQSEPTPYELLEVAPGATPAAVEQAFAAAVPRKPALINRLKSARDLLKQRPRERVLVDLLLYDDAGLAHATPNPLAQPDALESAQRPTTAAAWEKAFRDTWPSLVMGHNLAVLWYWWAVHAEQQDPNARAADAIKYWQRAIAYWAMLLATPAFLAAPAARSATPAETLRMDLVQHLRDRFRDGIRSYRNAGREELMEAYRGLELALATELRVADELAAIGIRTAYGPVCCGPMLLRLHQRLGALRRRVEQALERKPGDPRLLRLNAALSPNARIAVLLDQERPAQALDALAGLPPAEQEQREAQALRARALYAQGNALAAHGRVAEALSMWAEAAAVSRRLEIAGPDGFAERVAGLCTDAVLARQDRDLDGAIDLLGGGLELVRDADLAATLGELLTRRAEQTLARRDDPDEAATEEQLRLALADLLRAEGLGYRRAAEQAVLLRQTLKQRPDFAVLPEPVAARARAAERAVAGEQWNVASGHWQAVVAHLRRALRTAHRDTAESLQRALLTCLVRLARAKLRRGLGLWHDNAGDAREQEILSLCDAARRDLEEAVALDPESGVAADQVQEIEHSRAKLVQTVRQRRLLRWANDAAGRQDWSGACAFLAVAVEDARPELQEALNQQLAVALANLSVRQVKRGMAQVRGSLMDPARMSAGFSEVYEAYVELAYAVTLHFGEPTLAKHLHDAGAIQSQLRVRLEQLAGADEVVAAEQAALQHRQARAEAWRRRVAADLEAKPRPMPKTRPSPAVGPQRIGEPPPPAEPCPTAPQPEPAPRAPPRQCLVGYAWVGSMALVAALAGWGLAGRFAPGLGLAPKALAAMLLGGPVGGLLAALQTRALALWRAGGSHARVGLALGLLVVLPAYVVLGIGLAGLYPGTAPAPAAAPNDVSSAGQPPTLADWAPYIDRSVVVTLGDGRLRRGRLVAVGDNNVVLARRDSSLGMRVRPATNVQLADIASIDVASP